MQYLPGIFNMETDFHSRSVTKLSELKLISEIFRMICKALGSPDVDFFVSRMSQQLPMYISWKPEPFAEGQVPSSNQGET